VGRQHAGGLPPHNQLHFDEELVCVGGQQAELCPPTQTSLRRHVVVDVVGGRQHAGGLPPTNYINYYMEFRVVCRRQAFGMLPPTHNPKFTLVADGEGEKAFGRFSPSPSPTKVL